MATRTKPLVTAATLASAAAIVVAGTAIAPSLNLPTPNALSAAKVQLATFTDVLSVPAVEWTDLLFGNTEWGGVLSSTNYGPDWAAPQDQFGQPGYVNPWAPYCGGGCYQSGISGAAYLFFDALVNGDGLGYDNSDQWSTGLVNYLWEPNSVFIIGGGSSPNLQYVSEGWSAASWYILQGTLGQAIPGLTLPLAAAYWGPTNVSVFYNLGLSITAALVSQVPGVGPFVGNSILAYLGDLEIPDSGGELLPVRSVGRAELLDRHRHRFGTVPQRFNAGSRGFGGCADCCPDSGRRGRHGHGTREHSGFGCEGFGGHGAGEHPGG